MKKPIILIVDDEPDLREAIAFDFLRQNFTVFLAASGHEAYRMVEENEIDLVLSDIRMTNGGGMELLDRIKARNPIQPVVMLITGFAEITLEEALARGADAVFPKPFDRDLLMQAVLKAIQPASQHLMRRYSRVELDVPIQVKVKGQPYTGKLVNIGRNGIFAELPALSLSIADEVDFQFEAQSWGPRLSMTGRGVARWVRTEGEPAKPTGCGIEFTDLSPDSSRNVADLINFAKTKSQISMG